MASNPLQPITARLACREGKRDALYNLYLKPGSKAGLWDCAFEYGRRGSTLRAGTKAQNVPYQVAYDAYQKALNKQLTESPPYHPVGSTGGPTVAPAVAPPAGSRLLIPMQPGVDIEPGPAEQMYLDSLKWDMMQKYDGIAVMTIVAPQLVVGSQKQGKPRAIPVIVETALKALGVVAGFQGEMFADYYVIYDIWQSGKQSLRTLNSRERRAKLCEIIPAGDKVLRLSDWYDTPATKKAALTKFKKERYEGVIFRHADSLYVEGDTNLLIKDKFVTSASFIVRAVNLNTDADTGTSDGKNSITIGLHDFPGFESKVSMNGKEKLQVGDVIDVRYLYAHQGIERGKEVGSISQARLDDKGPRGCARRDDVSKKECLRSQLKYKREVE